MFKKSRIKIVVSIMAIMTLLLAGTVGVIFVSSYSEMSERNLHMLERYARIYSEHGNPEQENNNPTPPENADGDNRENIPPKPQGDNEDLERERLYSVTFSSNKSVKSTDINNDNIEPKVIVNLGEAVLNSGEEKGTIEGYNYLVDKTDKYTLVVFLDRSEFNRNIDTLIKYTVIYGVISLLVIFVLALILSKLIIKPLEQNDKKQRQFVSDAGHELKTPVSVISTNADVLEDEIGENKWLSNIRYENERMSSLIKQLMQLAKSEKDDNQKEQLDFSKLVIGEILPFESVAYDKGIIINYDEVESGVIVKGNRASLGQLVSILVDNAIEHSTDSGEVVVKLSNVRGKAQLSVSNKGENIPEEKRELIFERFYRIDESRTEKKDHYGLGLAIAKSITESHGGEISVKSENGLITFTVKF
ncbi:MAG: ATP-binding protein [Ruminococcus sp.]|nr:ATP-binding protein [Ruminococcus sp.]